MNDGFVPMRHTRCNILHTCSAILLAALSSAALPPRSSAQTARVAGADSLDLATRIFGLSLVWQHAAYNFPYFDQLEGLDWDDAYRRFIPRVAAARSTLDYYRELQQFMALLRDGHSRVHLPDSIVRRHAFSGPWIELRAVGGRPLVANVAVELADSLPPGSEITEVDGLPVATYIDERVLPFVFAFAAHSRRISAIEGSFARGYGLLVGPADSTVRLVARTPGGQTVRLSLVRDRFSRSRTWVRPVDARPRPSVALEWRDGDVAYLTINTFSDPGVVSRVDSLLPELRRATGVIIDLRANGGGSDVPATAVLARFTDQPLIGTSARVRVNDAYYRALGSFGRPALVRALPDSPALVDSAVRHFANDAWRVEPPDTVRPEFTGARVRAPIAVLIGPRTASAAENFVARLPDDPRFITVGAPTAASTGQPLVFLLPGGGTGQVVTRAVLLSDGTPLVHSGILPDHAIEPTIDDIRAGRDPALDEAIRLLRNRGRR
jgi:C-terminal processing protease CtpA/Prc